MKDFGLMVVTAEKPLFTVSMGSFKKTIVF